VVGGDAARPTPPTHGPLLLSFSVLGMAACAAVGAAVLSTAAKLGPDAAPAPPADADAKQARRVERLDPRAPPPPPKKE